MIFVKVPAGMEDYLNKNSIKILKSPQLRLVTHLDVDAAGIDRALAAFRTLAA